MTMGPINPGKNINPAIIQAENKIPRGKQERACNTWSFEMALWVIVWCWCLIHPGLKVQISPCIIHTMHYRQAESLKPVLYRFTSCMQPTRCYSVSCIMEIIVFFGLDCQEFLIYLFSIYRSTYLNMLCSVYYTECKVLFKLWHGISFQQCITWVKMHAIKV